MQTFSFLNPLTKRLCDIHSFHRLSRNDRGIACRSSPLSEGIGCCASQHPVSTDGWWYVYKSLQSHFYHACPTSAIRNRPHNYLSEVWISWRCVSSRSKLVGIKEMQCRQILPKLILLQVLAPSLWTIANFATVATSASSSFNDWKYLIVIKRKKGGSCDLLSF